MGARSENLSIRFPLKSYLDRIFIAICDRYRCFSDYFRFTGNFRLHGTILPGRYLTKHYVMLCPPTSAQNCFPLKTRHCDLSVSESNWIKLLLKNFDDRNWLFVRNWIKFSCLSGTYFGEDLSIGQRFRCTVSSYSFIKK